MSDSFLSLYQRDVDLQHDEGPLAPLPTREEVFRALDTFKQVDLVIIGGGLSGVTLARAAALQGSDVLLVEPGYFGEQSVPWRNYISTALTERPITAVRTLWALKTVSTDVAPHLATAPVWQPETPRRFFGRFSAWLAQRAWRDGGGGNALSIIPDIDERLLIRETALAARQEGAFVLSAATASYVERDADTGGFRVGVKDLLSEERVEMTATTLFIDPTYAHPVASRIGTSITRRSLPQTSSCSVVYSVHQPAEGADPVDRYRTVTLGDGSEGSAYRFAPDLVEVCVVDDAADSERVTRRAQEVCERCGYLIIDEVSRRAIGRSFDTRSLVSHRRGVLITEERVPWEIFSLTSKILSKVPSCGIVRRDRRPLPGEWRDNERERFIDAARSAGVSEITIANALNRWRGRVRYLPLMENGLREVCPGVLNGEVSLAVVSDQVASVEDLLFGSLALQQVVGWRGLVPALTQALSERGIGREIRN